ncbi:MAG: hypothetical protein U0229_12665 [Anaeromyxobacter sp.]
MTTARAAALAALLFTTAPARADVPEDPWQAGEARPFVAGLVDLGSSQAALVAAGWGKPHFMWAGAVTRGWLTTDFAAVRPGVRVDLAALGLEAGLRFGRSFKHLTMPEADDHAALPERHGYTARMLDLSASGGLPAGPGFAIYEVLGVKLLSRHGEVDVYDELLRIVYRPPWLATASAGWLASLRNGALLAGGRAQWAFHTGRGGDPFVRAGPLVYWRAWPHVALVGELLYPVSKPDRLGFTDPIEAFLVFEVTAASGMSPPRFP